MDGSLVLVLNAILSCLLRTRGVTGRLKEAKDGRALFLRLQSAGFGVAENPSRDVVQWKNAKNCISVPVILDRIKVENLCHTD